MHSFDMVSTPVVAGESACAGDHGVWQSYSTMSLQLSSAVSSAVSMAQSGYS